MFNTVKGTVTEIGPEKKRTSIFVHYEYICVKNEAGQNKRIEGLTALNSVNEFLSLGNTGEFFLYTKHKFPTLLGVEMGGKYYYPRKDLLDQVRGQKITFKILAAMIAAVAGLALFFNNQDLFLGFLLVFAAFIPAHFYLLSQNKKLASEKTLTEMQKSGFGSTYESI